MHMGNPSYDPTDLGRCTQPISMHHGPDHPGPESHLQTIPGAYKCWSWFVQLALSFPYAYSSLWLLTYCLPMCWLILLADWCLLTISNTLTQHVFCLLRYLEQYISSSSSSQSTSFSHQCLCQCLCSLLPLTGYEPRSCLNIWGLMGALYSFYLRPGEGFILI